MDAAEIFEDLDKLYQQIQKEDKRCEKFHKRLCNELYREATIFHDQEINSQQKSRIDYLTMRCSLEIAEFMMKRIYHNEEDTDVDRQSLKVLTREELYKARLKNFLSKVPPEYHEGCKEVFDESEEANKYQDDFRYNSFEHAKKLLWEEFPEMSEFSGNSILLMNYHCFECIWQFCDKVSNSLSQYNEV